MGKVLEVSGLQKTYGRFSLKEVSFSLEEECITGFIGANGAGKTTTIRSILGLANRDGGTIQIFGKELRGNERELKDRIGVVLDDGCFYEGLTIKEMKGVLAPAYSRWNDIQYKEYLERFSLNPKQRIATLSRGMKLKLALAFALSHEADLLMMDEPTSGLDPLVRSELMGILQDYMKQGGKSVFFSTHILSDLDKVADMLILIDQGKIILEGEKDALVETHRLVKGDKEKLDDENRKLFLTLEETSFGFAGLTREGDRVKAAIPGVLLERPSLEDIMLGYVGRD